MNNISPYRIIGRANAARQQLLAKYSLAASDPSADTIMVLLALQQRVYGKDKELCGLLALKVQQCRSQIENMHISASDSLHETIAGEKEGIYIFNRYSSDYHDRLIEDRDFTPEIQAYEEKKKQQKKRNQRITLGVLGAIVLAIIIYNLPYFAEQRAFHKVEETIAEGSYYIYDTAIERYRSDYPDGRHLEEVLMLPVRSCAELDKPIYTIKAAEKYLDQFPDGKYSDEITEIYNNIWNDEISRFNEHAADKASTEGAGFVRAMLNYMKDKRISTIAVIGNPSLNLKEYAEYPEAVRFLLELVANENSDIKLPDDMVTIKDKITAKQALEWTSIIIEGLQNSFDHVLTPGFITFVDKANADPKCPEVKVDYTVSTQENDESGYACPEIWVYTSSLNNLVMSKSYILGIGMTFAARFTLPDSNTVYNIRGEGDAGSADIHADRDKAYNIMCERCTKQFSDKIAAQFGIAD